MVKTLVLLSIGALLSGGGAYASAPSFALWSARASAASDAAVRVAWTGCEKQHGSDDAAWGACAVAALQRAFTQHDKVAAKRPLRVIFRGAPPKCMRAIGAYGAASSRFEAAEMIYFRTHAHVLASEIQHEINGEPYATLRQIEREAQAHAIRICG